MVTVDSRISAGAAAAGPTLSSAPCQQCYCRPSSAAIRLAGFSISCGAVPVIARKAFSMRRGAGLCHECGRGCIGQHLAAMQHDHPIGVRHLVAQVRRPQHCDAALGAHAEQELAADSLRLGGSRPTVGLIHQQHPRSMQKRAPAPGVGGFRPESWRSCDGRAPSAPAAHELRRRCASAPRRAAFHAGLHENMRLAVTVSSRSRVGLEYDTELRQRRHRSRVMSWPITSMRPESGATGRRAAGTAWSCRRHLGRAGQ